jgi:glycerol-3-phosphate responsive antiterminator
VRLPIVCYQQLDQSAITSESDAMTMTIAIIFQENVTSTELMPFIMPYFNINIARKNKAKALAGGWRPFTDVLSNESDGG